MTDRGSVSLWIEQLKAGDSSAVQPLWERFYRRLVGLARLKLGDMPRGVCDEEDVVQSAFNSFVQRARDGQFPRLADRDDLWSLLVVITQRKALNRRAYERRAKRGGGRVRDRAIPGRADESMDELGQIICSEPSPEFAAQVVLNRKPRTDMRQSVGIAGRSPGSFSWAMSCCVTSVTSTAQ